MILSDLQWLSKIFNDTKRRAVSLRQLSLYDLASVIILSPAAAFTLRCYSVDNAVARCLSVRLFVHLSVRHTSVLCRNVYVSSIFSPYSGSHAILVFHIKPYEIFRWGPPNEGAECKGVWKTRDVWPRYRALCRKWYKMESQLLHVWTANRKP